MRNDIENKVENNNYMLESVARKDALKATITFNNFLFQYENTILYLFNALRKVRDKIKKKYQFQEKTSIIGIIFYKGLLIELYVYVYILMYKEIINLYISSGTLCVFLKYIIL